MRVLMLNHNTRGRSTFFRAFYLARELAVRGHDLTLATIASAARGRSRESMSEGVRIVETPDLAWGRGRTGWDPWDALWRVQRFLREPWDVVHGFDCRPVVLAPSLALRSLRRTPWISDWADWWGRGGAISERDSFVGRVLFSPIETTLEEAFRPWAAHVTVTSRALRGRALGLGLADDRVHLLPSGANVTTIRVRERIDCRQALGLSPVAPTACFMGFVQYDLDLALRAFAVARSRLPEARLLLVGPLGEQVKALIGSLGIASSVDAVGVQPFDQIDRYLGAADLLLLPMSDRLMNRARGPIKLGDYLAAGRPVLANPVGDLLEIFARDEVGRLVADSPEAYGQAMAALLGDPALCARLGQRAREVAEQRYAWSRTAPRLEAIYDRAIAGF